MPVCDWKTVQEPKKSEKPSSTDHQLLETRVCFSWAHVQSSNILESESGSNILESESESNILESESESNILDSECQ